MPNRTIYLNDEQAAKYDKIKDKSKFVQNALSALTATTEHKLHEWDVSDEHGWRKIELWVQDKELLLVAYNKEGEEVPHHLWQGEYR